MSAHRSQNRRSKLVQRDSSGCVRRSRFLEPVADFRGRPVCGTTFRRNGRLLYTCYFSDPYDVPVIPSPQRSMLVELQRRLSKQIAEYRLSGLFSYSELRMIEALMTGTGLRAYARREGVSPQAIEDRIQRLKERAPLFWRFWRRKNQMRARR
jgi:hypothetical protein